MRSILVLLLFAVLFGSCQSDQPAEKTASSNPSPAIRPPLPEADVPFNDYVIDADKGDTIFASSGSILVFPAQSLIDDKGKLVTGKVKVCFREFVDPLDQYLAGIPMTFDSAGGKIQFVSSGMCEIKVLKDSVPVFVNPNRKPTVHLVATNNNIDDQLYYFDTVQKRWVADGKITTTYPDRRLAPAPKRPTVMADAPPLVPPVLPGQITGNNPVLEVKIDPTSFTELGQFDNLQFQVDGPFDPKDSEEQWHDMSLERSEQPGKYILKFTNARRSVSYVARPVLEGKDLEKAKEVYNKALAVFKQKLAARQARMEEAKKQFTEDSVKQEMANKMQDELAVQLMALLKEKNDRIEAQNKIIAGRNKQTEKANLETARRVKERETQNKVLDSLRKVTEEKYRAQQTEARTSVKKAAPVTAREVMKETDPLAARKALEVARVERVYRSFTLNRLGVLNVDVVRPLIFFAVTPDFRDEAGNKLELTHVGATVQGMNGAIMMDGDVVTLIEGVGMTIWGVVGNQLAFLDGKSYRALNITPATKQVTLVMKLTPIGRNNYEYVRELIGQRPLP